MRPTFFKNDSLGFDSFEGFTKGETWNGWDCPYFSFEQANKILKTFNDLRSIIGQSDLAYYDSGADSFVFPINDEDPEIYYADIEDGIKYYPIGAFSWIWEESD